MSVVMLDMITLVLQGIESLVFDLPAGAAAFHRLLYILPGNGQVFHPTVVIGDFPIFINEFRLYLNRNSA